MRFTKFFLIICAIIFNTKLHAEILLVQPSGTCTNTTGRLTTVTTDSWTNNTICYADLTTAISQASANDEIWVTAGTYNKAGAITINKTLKIYGGFTGNETSVVDRKLLDIHSVNRTILKQTNINALGSQNGVIRITGNAVVLDGLTFTGGVVDTLWSGAGVYCIGNSSTIIRCIFESNTNNYDASANQESAGSALHYSNGQIVGGNHTVRQCYFVNNTKQNSSGGVVTGRVNNLLLENCLFVGNQTNSNNFKMINLWSSNVLFRNNTMANNNNGTTATNGGYVRSGGGTYTWENVLVSENSYTGSITIPGFTMADISEFKNPPAGTGIISDWQTYDWSLQLSSPRIDAGTNSTWTNSDVDLNGDARIINGKVDLGAFEFSNVRYVTESGAGTKSGLTWDNAASADELQAMISDTNTSVIYIAKGTYNITAQLEVSTPKKIYGGFSGTEYALSDRDLSLIHSTNETTIRQTGTTSVTNRVFYVSVADAVIDGLTITGGFLNNSAYGGGIWSRRSITISNCYIHSNISSAGGGGIAIDDGANNRIDRSFIENCWIANNQAASNNGIGGGIFSRGPETPLDIVNTILSNNYAQNYGGGFGTANSVTGGITVSTINIINCTVVKNRTSQLSSNTGNNNKASGISPASGMGTMYKNTLIWGNRCDALSGVNQQYNCRNHISSSLINCAIEGTGTIFTAEGVGSVIDPVGSGYVTTVENNIVLTSTDPEFVAPITTLSVTPDWRTANWSLKPTSPLINRGTNIGVLSPKDVAGNTRIWNPSGRTDGIIDIGAYEQTQKAIRAITFSGTTSFVYNATVQAPETTAVDNTSDNRLPVGNWGEIAVYSDANYTTLVPSPIIPATYYSKFVDTNGHWTESGGSYTIVPKVYTVAFNTNGGTGTMTPQIFSFGSSAAQVLKTNTFLRTGYTFDGWATTASGPVVYNNQHSMVHDTYATQNGTLTLYAKWTAIPYAIVYSGNSISSNGVPLVGAPNIPDATLDATYGLAMPATTIPTLTGYTFNGYYDTPAATGGTQYYTSSMASARTWNKTSGAVLYARWTAQSHTIAFNANGSGASTGTPATVSATVGMPMPAAVTAPTRPGYTFQGYFDAATGGTQYYTASMAGTQNWDKGGNTTLYAQWTVNTYTVLFSGNTISSNGDALIGTPSIPAATVTATYDAAMPIPSPSTPPTLQGYTFAGYYDTNAATGGTQYYTASMTSSRTWNIASITTLYARWIPLTYTVTLDKQNGTGGASSLPATYYGALMSSTTAPTRPGYLFAGYYASPNGEGTQYYNSAMVGVNPWDIVGNDTIYAYWTGTIRYITLTGAGNKTGSSWANAGDGTQIGRLASDVGVTEVWIAQGEHNITVEQTITNPGVNIYGGFVGGETGTTATATTPPRNPETNVTTIKQTGTPGPQNRVLYISAAGGTVTINGLTITGGNIAGNYRGAGIYAVSTVNIENCIIDGNSAPDGTGGGLYLSGTRSVVKGCKITNNDASNGGGIYSEATDVNIMATDLFQNIASVNGGGLWLGGSNATITGCKITENSLTGTTSAGGGIYAGGSFNKIASCIIAGNAVGTISNAATQWGGGICINTAGSATTNVIENCLIANNRAGQGGGVLIVSTGYYMNMRNSTVVNNFASTTASSGGIAGASSNTNYRTIRNTIIWGNKQGSNINTAIGVSIAEGCALEGVGVSGGNVYNLNPINGHVAGPNFVIPTVTATANATRWAVNSDWTLTPTSPLINRGASTIWSPVADTTDLAGNPRIFLGANGVGKVDIGAYEQTDIAVRSVTYDFISFVYNATTRKPSATDATSDSRTPAGVWTTTAYSDGTFTTTVANPTTPGTYYVKSTDGNGHWTEIGSSYTIVPKVYTVRFNSNAGSGTMTDQLLSFSSTATTPLSANTFTRAGYVFIGWATSAAGAVVYSDLHAMDHSTFTTPNGILNLYAVWTVTPVTLTAQTATPTIYGNTGYSYNIVATSGSGSYTFSLASGSLPTGFTLSNAGVLTAPTVTANAGTYNLSIKVIDANTSTATANITLVISPKAITLSTTASKVYDGNNTLSLANVLPNSWAGPIGGIVGSEVITLTGLTGAQYTSANAHPTTLITNTGTPTYTHGASATALANYTITLNITGNITPKPITLTSTASKTYDGSNALTFAEIPAGSKSWTGPTGGIVSGQVIALNALTGSTYNSANVHNTLPTTGGAPTYSYSNGADAGNYNITLNVSGTINPKAITLSTTATKVYDGNNVVELANLAKTSWTNADNTNIISGDMLTLSALSGATYANANYHTATALAAQGLKTWTGTNLNYNITFTITTGAISKATVYVNALPQTKVYGSSDPTFTYVYTPNPLITGNSFTGTLSRTAGTNVGSYPISIGTLSAGNNYAITYTGADLTIIAAGGALTIDPITAVTYNGSAQTPTVVVKNAGGTILTLNTDYTISYSNNTNAGVASVTVNGINGYAGALGSSSFTINPKAVTITSTATKVYDGNNIINISDLSTTTWTGTGGLIATQTITLTTLGGTTYNLTNVHSSLAAIPGTPTYSYTNGAAANNYTITLNITGNITAKPVTLTSTATKVYDGNNSLALAEMATTSWTGTTGGIVGGETITLNTLTGAQYTNANVHGSTLITTKGTSTFTGAGNYVVTLNITGSITAKPITLTSTATKVYNGNNTLSIDDVTTKSWTGTNGIITGQTVTLATLTGAQYINANIHAPTLITTKGTSSFTNSTNYIITFDITGSITAKDITLTTTAAKVYDGNNMVTLTNLDKTSWTNADNANIINGDVFTLSNLTGATYTNANYHTATALSNQGAITWAGVNFGNYNITFTITTGAINKATVQVIVDAKSKIFGATEPVFTYTSVPSSLITGNTFTGALARIPGETAGSYPINIGTLSAGNNYTIVYTGANLTIIPSAGSLSIDAIADVTYNGLPQTPSIVVKNGATTLIAGTDYTVSYTNNISAGTNTAIVNVTGTGTYIGASGSATFTILPKAITLTTTASKVYDGNNGVTMANLAKTSWTNADNTNIISGDVLTLSVLSGATYTNANYHTPTALSAQGTKTWTGLNSGNYNITFTITTGAIHKAPLSVNGFNITKVYDGNNTVTNFGSPAFSGFIGSENATVTIAASTYNDATVGGSKPITMGIVTMTGGSAMAINYNIIQPIGITGSITSSMGALTINPIAAVTYTGSAQNPTIVVKSGTTVLTANTDYTVTINNNTNAGTAVVNVTGVGGYAGAFGNANFTINPKPVTVTGYSITKVYDGTTTVTNFGSPSFNGLVGAETATVNTGTSTYDTKEVGTGKAITLGTVTMTGGSAIASNYVITQPTGIIGIITTKSLTVNGFNISKVYDGNNTVNNFGTPVFNGLVGAEMATVTIAASTYNDATVGTGKTITLGVITATAGTGGFIASNYDIISPTGITGIITPSTSSLTIEPISAVLTYNGSPQTPTVVVKSGGRTLVVNTDYTVTYLYNTNAGIATVNVTGTNGYIGASASANFTINPKTITVTGFNITKVYDANDNVTAFGTLSFAGLVAGEASTVNTFGVTATYNNANVGTGKSISYTGTFSMIGGNAIASNYTITQPSSLTGMITALRITKPTVMGTLTYNGSAQSPTIPTNAAYTITGNSQTNAGSYNATVTLISTNNYQWADGTTTVLTLPWTIEKASVIIVATPQTKAFGDADPTLTYSYTPNPLIAGNSLTGTLQRAAGEELGTYLINQGTLSAGNNYVMTYTSAHLTVTPSVGSLSIDPIPFVTYNGTAQRPEVTVRNNAGVVLPNTDYTVAYSNNINAGTDATVIVMGTNGYTGTFVTQFTILPKEITLTSTVSKPYDGTTTLSLDEMATTSWNDITSGLVNGQIITLTALTNAQYTNVNAHTNTLITTNGTPTYSYSGGAIASNYVITLEQIGSITKAPLTITANDLNKLMGKVIRPTGTEFTATGLKNGETIDKVTLTCSQFGSTTAAQGSYPIGISNPTGGTFNVENYTITYVNGTLTIGKSLKNNTIAVTPPADVFYDGLEHKENPIVKDGTTVLSEGVDYTLSYSNDVVNIGTVTVTITGIGYYGESRTTTYKIKPQVYTVTFESNGGTAVANMKIEKGAKIQIPQDPTKYRYLLEYWYKDAELTEIWDFETEEVYRDITLYAKWSRPYIKVYFDGAEGTAAYTVDTVQYGDPYQKFPDVRYMNYPLVGWYNEEGEVVNPTDTLFTTQQTMTLYARFRTDFNQPEKNNHVVTPNGDGLNDRLYINFLAKDNQPISNATVYIYNRTGNVVYRLGHYEMHDGDFDGKDLASGTYILFIHYMAGSKSKNYQGSISIIREP